VPGHGVSSTTTHAPGARPPEELSRLLAPGPVTRARAHLSHAALDRALADGTDPSASPLLAARAAQLAAPRERRRIAQGLERAAASADGPRGRVKVLPARRAIRANRAELMALADELRGGAPAYVRGLASVRLVLGDGAGPAYTDPDGAALGQQLQLARRRLAG